MYAPAGSLLIYILGVALDVIASFSRMKTLSEDMEVIKAALAKESSVIELNEDKSMVRRREALPESTETMSRSAYIKGFPTSATLDEIQACLEPHSAHIQAVRMRRVPNSKEFKGSVFVEFATEEEAKRFATLSISFNSTPLIIKSKLAYFEEKNAERTGKKNNPKTVALLERMGRGRLLKIEDFPAEGITHELLKETLKDTFPVAYVDFSYENGCAWIRLKEAVADKLAAEFGGEGKALEIGEFKLNKFVVADEDMQLKYYEETMMKSRGGQKRGSNQRGPRGASKEDSEERSEKVAKVEEVSAPAAETDSVQA